MLKLDMFQETSNSKQQSHTQLTESKLNVASPSFLKDTSLNHGAVHMTLFNLYENCIESLTLSFSK